MTDPAPLRFFASFALALCVTLAMLWIGLEVSGFTERQPRRELPTHAVSVVSEAERRAFTELLQPSLGPSPMLAPLAEIEPLDLSRDVRGIVQLEVRIDAAGAVVDTRVIDATPAGVYERQAIASVLARRYAPEIVAGRAVPSRRLEIVDFDLPASEIAVPEGR